MALDNFFRFVSDFKSVAALIGKAALLAPFIDLLLNIGPPWPTRTGVPALTSLAEVFVLIYIFQFYTPLSRKRLENRLRKFFILTIVCFIFYISMYSFFVYEATTTKLRDVKGFIVRPEIQKIVGPNRTLDRVLEGAEWDAERVWETWTVHTMRISLLLAWILFFVGIAGCIAIFVTLQKKARPAKTQSVILEPGHP